MWLFFNQPKDGSTSATGYNGWLDIIGYCHASGRWAVRSRTTTSPVTNRTGRGSVGEGMNHEWTMSFNSLFKVHQSKTENEKWKSHSHVESIEICFLIPRFVLNNSRRIMSIRGNSSCFICAVQSACIGCTSHGHQLDGLVLSHTGKTQIHRIQKLSVGKTGKTYTQSPHQDQARKRQGSSSRKSTKGSEMLPPNLQSVTSTIINTSTKMKGLTYWVYWLISNVKFQHCHWRWRYVTIDARWQMSKDLSFH